MEKQKEKICKPYANRASQQLGRASGNGFFICGGLGHDTGTDDDQQTGDCRGEKCSADATRKISNSNLLKLQCWADNGRNCNIWKPYLDLDRDYDGICEVLRRDGYIAKAIDEFYGIRILNQEPWETLCSFIISQNNNIPRIKGIIDRLCESFGEPIATADEKTLYSFPSAQTVAKLTEEDLSPLRAGFRNKYIIDAAQKVASGEVDLKKIKELPLVEAEAELLKIKGVGPKVAQCALLYGCGQIDAFPVDVWVKRIMGEMYQNGLPDCTNGVRGIAQQYLFHWRRNSAHENFNPEHVKTST